MLYSKNGSIPKDHMSGDKAGWVEVEEAPIAPEGKEVVWWYPPGWVVRDPQPGPDWFWSQSEERWIKYTIPEVEEVVVTTTEENQVDAGTAISG